MQSYSEVCIIKKFKKYQYFDIILLQGPCDGEDRKFTAEFYNAAQYPIDIFWVSNEGKEEKIVSKLAEGGETVIPTKPAHQWIFKGSDNNLDLLASSHGIQSKLFSGCDFGAEDDSTMHVQIRNGN